MLPFVNRPLPLPCAVQAACNPNGRQLPEAHDGELRLLSFNIQVGISTQKFHHYLTRGWKHLLPHQGRMQNLRSIAELVADYDLVALQEVDGGSLRSGFMNQVEYLAYKAHFPYWYSQLNRDLGPLAQHGNGLLSRVEPQALEDHKLPGMIPGRGALLMKFSFGQADVLVVFLHLSLGERSRQRQLSYVRELIQGHERVVVMGDMNSHLSRLLEGSPLSGCGLIPADDVQPTYPSWRPSVALDHVHTDLPAGHDHIRDAVPVSDGFKHSHPYTVDMHHGHWPEPGGLVRAMHHPRSGHDR